MEHVSRIDYIFLLGMAVAIISFYALIYFYLLRLDPGGIHFVSDSTGGADLLNFSTLTFANLGFDGLVAAAGDAGGDADGAGLPGGQGRTAVGGRRRGGGRLGGRGRRRRSGSRGCTARCGGR